TRIAIVGRIPISSYIYMTEPQPINKLGPHPAHQHRAAPYTTPRIDKLSNEILWRIFLINSDAKAEDALAIDTLRLSSQVCSRWRALILSSSSLWGQVLDMSALANQEWRDEVLRRTGESPLCVLGNSNSRGWVPSHSKTTVDLVDAHWARIRWLELVLTNHEWADSGHEVDIWAIFARPTSMLKVFRIMFNTPQQGNLMHAPIISPPDFLVFSNTAPALHTCYALNIAFSLSAPWLVHVRYLSLSAPVSAHDVLRAMTQMPFLRCLADESSNAITHTGDLASLSESSQHVIPRAFDQILVAAYLNIEVYLDFLSSLTLLSRLKTCAHPLSLSLTYEGPTPSPSTLDLAMRVLHTYSRSCSIESAIDLCVTLAPFHFGLEAQFPDVNSAPRPFCFDLQFTDPHLPSVSEHITSFFAVLPISSSTATTFPHVEILTIQICPSLSLTPILSMKLAAFVAALPNVEHLFTTPFTLRFLQLLSLPEFAGTPFLFPRLQNVTLTECPEPSDAAALQDFLAPRFGVSTNSPSPPSLATTTTSSTVTQTGSESTKNNMPTTYILNHTSLYTPVLKTLIILITPRDRADLRYLDEYTELKVVFELENELQLPLISGDSGGDSGARGEEVGSQPIMEYVCGDGHCEDLIVGRRGQISQTDM
ncbi:hypothetical protein H0H81_011526, partial [Sphagnurus paluster]